jgi:tetratricopeptide (TPR) repeat protein
VALQKRQPTPAPQPASQPIPVPASTKQRPGSERRPRLAADPRSPFFARVAAEYFQEGRIREAQALCLEGTRVFPRYGTGALILGKCYAALGRHTEALLEFRRAQQSVPDNAVVRSLVREAEQRLQESYTQFVNGLDAGFLEQKDTTGLEEFLAGTEPAQVNTVDLLIRQLQQAPKRQRAPVVPVAPMEQEDLSTPAEQAPVIVTETLAEIYASQGQFREAIQAYTTLSAGKPEETERFAKRIAQLEELLRLEEDKGS